MILILVIFDPSHVIIIQKLVTVLTYSHFDPLAKLGNSLKVYKGVVVLGFSSSHPPPPPPPKKKLHTISRKKRLN